MVEFVSYDGRYPNLCQGQLVVRIDGKEVNLGKCLVSKGSCYFNSNWEAHVTQGEWDIDDLPDEYEKFRQEIIEVVNDNVLCGCCGGCL